MKYSVSDIIKSSLDFVVVLGSGYTNTLNSLKLIETVPYSEIQEAITPTVKGHSGTLELRQGNNKNVLILRGRTHMYEGYSAKETTQFIDAIVKTQKNPKPVFILTNAAGSTNTEFPPGSIVAIKDHINTIWKTPLSGPEFIDMTEVYNKDLIELLQEKAKKLNIKLGTGVYAITPGPQYETPAEVRMLKLLGADLLGMSTVPEAITLQSLGIKKLAISIVSNLATGISDKKLSHKEVAQTVQEAETNISKLLEAFING